MKFGVAVIGFLGFITSNAVLWYAATRPAGVEFGELRTFRDLAMVIAGGGSGEPGATPDRDGG